MRLRTIAAIALLASACGSKPAPSTPTPVVAAPQISCPTDMTLKGVTGSTQAVTYSAPTVTGGATPVTTTCTQASGASFPLGTTSVKCTANDAQSRQAACSFSVTLTGFSIAATKYETVGDSLTEGETGRPNVAPSVLDVPNAYPTKLQQIFDATYPGQGLTVINRGLSGDTLEMTLAKINQYVPVDTPDAVLLLGGYNNLTGPCAAGLGASAGCKSAIDNALAFGVRDCIRHAKEASATVKYVFVSTLTPPGATGSNRIDGSAIIQANVRIRQMVASERVVLVDSYPLFEGHEADYVNVDGLHLRPAGYQALADAFFAAIKATIPQTPLFAINGSR
jgi:lysophospholipase L1-like esterase